MEIRFEFRIKIIRWWMAFRLTKTEDTTANNGHDPMNSSGSRPPIPAASKIVSGHRWNVHYWPTYSRPIGTKSDPSNSAGMRISGLPTPPFLLASYEACPKKLENTVVVWSEGRYPTCLYIWSANLAPNTPAKTAPVPKPIYMRPVTVGAKLYVVAKKSWEIKRSTRGTEN